MYFCYLIPYVVENPRQQICVFSMLVVYTHTLSKKYDELHILRCDWYVGNAISTSGFVSGGDFQLLLFSCLLLSMFCFSCGHTLAVGDVYCSKCGVRVTAAASPAGGTYLPLHCTFTINSAELNARKWTQTQSACYKKTLREFSPL